MPSSRRLIASQTLSSSAASVTFSSIPTGYRDLVLRCSVREDYASVGFSLRVKFNNDTNTVYSWTELLGNGSTAQSGRASNQAGRLDFYSTTGANATANTFGNAELYIPNYTVSANKPMSGFGVAESNAVSVNWIGATADLWRNTAAITSITLTALSNYVSGSSFYLYGLLES